MINLYEIAWESMGVYPEKVDNIPRSEYKTGWNNAVSEIINRVIKLEKWLNGIDPQIKEKLSDLEGTVQIAFDEEDIILTVDCSDTFYYACADYEVITLEEIAEIGNDFDDIAFICKRRNEKPVIEVIEKMKQEGKWTDELEALPDNECNKTTPRW